VVGLSILLVPLICSPAARDSFRYPKTLLFRGTAIVLVAIFATAAIWNRVQWRELLRDRATLIVIGAIALWSLITTLVSTNRALSLMAFEYTIEAVIFFFAAWIAVCGRTLGQVLIAPMIAGAINALLAISQATDWWNPFTFAANTNTHLRTSALLGNPNDAGNFLMLLAVIATIAAMVEKKTRWWVLTAVLLAGLVASQSLGAILSYIAALLVITFIASRRAGFIVIGSAVLATLIAFAVLPPLRARTTVMASAVAEGDWGTATSYRNYPIEVAWEMFKDRPLTGLGPGTFKFHFMDYRMKLNERHPEWVYKVVENYAEAHSDHLQLLAEEGVPGWLLLAAAIGVLMTASVRHWRVDDGEPDLFVHYAGAAFAVAFITIALGSFPLEMVAVLQLSVYFAAVILQWSTRP
jgi:O-antigen ligase